MNAVYMNYRPCRDFKGKEHEFNDVNMLTMLTSSLKMRKFGYHTKLYSDRFTYRFFEQLGLLGAWDEADGVSLKQQIDEEAYDVSYFFNIGKFYALLMEKAPVMLVDTDLILWEDVGERLKKNKAGFTHWEEVRPASEWYCKKEELTLPKGYEWKQEWDFNMQAANTSFMYFEREEDKELYCAEALRFMRKNCIRKKSIPSELYFVEQRLFPMCLLESGSWKETVPLIDTLWDPSKGAFVKKDDKLGWWDFFIPEPKQLITHTWIAKKTIAQTPAYRSYYCCRLLWELQQMDPVFEKKLEDTGLFDPYVRLLERFGTVEQMLEKQAASCILYE